jgi:hypothetical protein
MIHKRSKQIVILIPGLKRYVFDVVFAPAADEIFIVLRMQS